MATAPSFEVLIEKLRSPHLLKLAGPLLSKLHDTLWTIHFMLRDAEDKQLTPERVTVWLEDVRDLAFDLEDILDEVATLALRRQSMTDKKSLSITDKIRDLVPSPSALKLNRGFRSKIKHVCDRLHKLCEYGQSLALKTSREPSGPPDPLTRRTPSTFSPPAFFVGRDDEEKKILKMVLSDEPSDEGINFRVVSIAGKGGLGKTTLAQHVFNHQMVLEKFHIKAWVCVSLDFDVLRISKAILEAITFSRCDLTELNQVQVQLKEMFSGRRLLLVLDDVWESARDSWETLLAPINYAAPRSKVMVTTRNKRVAFSIGPTECYELQPLSDEFCWSLFSERVRPFQRVENLEFIREKVVQLCQGLPLAATTLGGLLRCKERREWERILDRRSGYMFDGSDVLPVLRLSYSYLPLHLKRCFAYCAIFPKDHEFKPEEVVYLWMAEGLIVQDVAESQMDNIGMGYFKDLCARALLGPSATNPGKFTMHDLVNDLAQSVAAETTFRLDGELDINQQFPSFERIRRFSYISSNYDCKNKFEFLKAVEGLRTFLPILQSGGTRYISNAVLFDLLPKLKRLRALSLEDYYITELPDSISGLTLLRYLNLSGTEIRCLPKSTCLLLNLEILKLRDCFRFKYLPSDIGNLICLHHLDIRGVNLKEMPSGMKKLKELRTLSNFVVGKGRGSCIKDLKSLSFLQGQLHILGLENVTDEQDTREAILSETVDLKVLLLEWGSVCTDSHVIAEQNDVLNMLRPHKYLEELTVKSYGGLNFPSWLGNPLFSKLLVLTLESCENCKFLPSLGLLSSLKNLTIKGMNGLKQIGSEIYGDGFSETFPSLENLRLENMQELEHWELVRENEHVECFRILRELFIVDCPKLSGRLPDSLFSLKELVVQECPKLVVSICHLPSLEKLMIHDCAELMVSSSNLTVLCEFEIHGCRRVVFRDPHNFRRLKSLTLSDVSDFSNGLVRGFAEIEYLKFVNSKELIEMWQKEMCLETSSHGMHSFVFLSELRIENCPGLISFPEPSLFPNLSKLGIVKCSDLESLPLGTKYNNPFLESVQIDGCNSLTCAIRGQLPSSVKQFSVTNCTKLELLLDDKDDTSAFPSISSVMHQEISNIASTSLLEKLCVSNCPSLVYLSSSGELPASLEHLEIQDCLELMTLSTRGQLPPGLRHLEVSGCVELETVSSVHLLPNKLQHLEVIDCPKLRSITQRFSENASLEFILIRDCRKLQSLPVGLHELQNLCEIHIVDCPRLLSFSEEGLPHTSLEVLSIQRCRTLNALPNNLHNLEALRRLAIQECPSIVSCPEGGFPSNLTSLSIADVNMYNQLSEWGLHNLTSLKELEIAGSQFSTSFPQENMGIKLPNSLTDLKIRGFQKLRYLSADFENLTSLEHLSISDCPELSSLPKQNLPSSLLQLHISKCPQLEKRCRKNKGEWSKIAQIPRVSINYKFIFDPEQEE